jgi:flagellar hook-length control protein FliK
MQAAGLQTAVLRAAVGATSPAVMTAMTPTLAAAPAAVPEAVPADPAGPALPPPAPGRPEAQASGAASATGPDATAVPALPTLPTVATAPADVAAVVERTPGKLPSRDQAETVTPATASGAVGQPPLAVQAGSPVAAAAPVTAAPPAMHLQVLHAVSPVVHGPDGSYSIQLQLAPNDLGQVQVTVDMADGRVSIHLHAVDPAAGAALRDSLPQLREQLEQQGLSTGNLDVGSGDAQRRPRPQNTQTAAPGGVSAPVPSEDPIQPTRAAHSAGALDVRM